MSPYPGFEPIQAFLFAAAAAQGLAVCMCIVLIALDETRRQPVTQQRAFDVVLPPEHMGEGMPGICRAVVASNHRKQEEASVAARGSGSTEHLGILADITSGRVYPILLRLNSGKNPGFNDAMERLTQEGGIAKRAACIDEPRAHDGGGRELL